MGDSKPTFEELRTRIKQDFAHYRGAAAEGAALVRDGYLAAPIEWGLISVSEHDRLLELLPPIKDSPAVAILLGRHEDARATSERPHRKSWARSSSGAGMATGRSF